MRTTIAALILLAATAASGPAAAQVYPWCAQYGFRGDGGGTNCGFATLAQCQATVSGVGGFCTRNLWYTPPAPKKKPDRRKG